MTVLQVPRRFVRAEWGGTEQVVLETCKSLLRHGHQTEVFCPNALSAVRHEEIGGVPVTRMPYFYPYLGLSSAARRQLDKKGGNLFSFSLMRALSQYSPLDLIHAHAGKRLGGICRYVARWRRLPYVISLHGGVFDVPPEEVSSWTEPTRGTVEWGKALGWLVGARRVLTDAAAIICVGRREYEAVSARFPHSRSIHLPNGVDTNRFAHGDGHRFRTAHGIAPDAHLILTVGRIDPQKNQRLYLDLLPRLLRQNLSAHAVLIGPATNEQYRTTLLRDAEADGLSDRFTLIPGVDASSSDLVDAYHAADVFLLPSVHEPFGIVILEAWAAGLPVVASRVGGVPALVQDGSTGLLADSGDVQAFADAIMTFARHPGRRNACAAAAREAARQYDWDTITTRLIALYEEVIYDYRLR